MSERDEVLVQQQRLVDRYDEAVALLRQLPGVLSVGVGARERRGEIVPELAYRVYVAEKIEEALLPESYRVPRDVSVIGFDDIALAAHANPPLTTVRQDLARGARTLVDLLFRRMAGEDTPSSTMPAELVIRESSG